MKKTKGSGLIFAVILLFVILAMVVTLSSVTVLETKMSQKTKSSAGAFYNSESGVEWALNKIAAKNSTDTINSAFSATGFDGSAAKCPSTFGTDTCKVLFLDQNGIVLATSATIDQVKAVRSVGTQNIGGTPDTQRAIEAAVAASGDYQISCWNGFGGGGDCCRINTSTGTGNCAWTGDMANWHSAPFPW